MRSELQRLCACWDSFPTLTPIDRTLCAHDRLTMIDDYAKGSSWIAGAICGRSGAGRSAAST
jgi:hypothetical protein